MIILLNQNLDVFCLGEEMNKLFIVLLCTGLLFGHSNYYGDTTAPVVLAGAIIKAKHTIDTTKYKRKDCPICKGKGWYISGDGIKKIECQYCEEDKGITKPVLIQK